MSDLLLEKMFETSRWEHAINVGLAKKIDKGELRKLTTPQLRARLYTAIKTGNYKISPPHQALIPKDKPGEFRTVYINENVDRIFLSIVNDLLFEVCDDMIHKSCVSYQKGIGCGKIVQRISALICTYKGWKSDLSKYFDSVAIEYIDKAFDAVEMRVGKSAVIDVLRDYYHTDLCFNTDGNLIEHYQSLKQGCAVASFLADVILYHIDETLSNMNGYYVRYSDDCLYIGEDYEAAMQKMGDMLGDMDMKLNPKKVEYVDNTRYFKFLGFSIKGDQISLSSGRIKTFQKEIAQRTIKKRTTTLKKAVNAVNKYLYVGDKDGHSWATNVLPIINNDNDIKQLNLYVMDCLRAVQTGKTKVGGLGYVPTQKGGVISRGIGKNVTANRGKTNKIIDGYMSLNCARLALLSDKSAYETLVRQL